MASVGARFIKGVAALHLRGLISAKAGILLYFLHCLSILQASGTLLVVRRMPVMTVQMPAKQMKLRLVRSLLNFLGNNRN